MLGKKDNTPDLKIPIVIHDEVGDDVIKADALLNLASGEIGQVRYRDYDADAEGYPFENEDYDFSSGVMSNNGKDVEFTITAHRAAESYSVSADELAEIKLRAAALFAAAPNAALSAELAHRPNPRGLGAISDSLTGKAPRKRAPKR
jgi:hypothetical protein